MNESVVFEDVPLLGNVTIHELHAAGLGIVGVLAGVGLRIGYTEEVATFTLGMMAMAFGLRKYLDIKVQSSAGSVLKREPWYFTVMYVVTSIAAWGVHPIVA